ncbi:MAG: hypothetical protein AB8G23_12290 [Myxococcota bacterium]
MKSVHAFSAGSSIRSLRWTACLIFALGFSQTASADEAPVLRFDPFGSRPEQVAAPRETAAPETGRGPILLSTIVRGDRSLVNLGGTILALEEESLGYRLLEVRAFDALFLKDGQEVRLEVKSPESDPS